MSPRVGEVTHVVRSCGEILVAISRASHLVVVDAPDLNKFNLKVSSVVYVGGIDPNVIGTMSAVHRNNDESAFDERRPQGETQCIGPNLEP